MLSKKLKKAFERECYYLEYYDKHKEFPFKKKRINIILRSDVIEMNRDKIANGEFSSFIEYKIKQKNLSFSS